MTICITSLSIKAGQVFSVAADFDAGKVYGRIQGWVENSIQSCDEEYTSSVAAAFTVLATLGAER